VYGKEIGGKKEELPPKTDPILPPPPGWTSEENVDDYPMPGEGPLQESQTSDPNPLPIPKWLSSDPSMAGIKVDFETEKPIQELSGEELTAELIKTRKEMGDDQRISEIKNELSNRWFLMGEAEPELNRLLNAEIVSRLKFQIGLDEVSERVKIMEANDPNKFKGIFGLVTEDSVWACEESFKSYIDGKDLRFLPFDSGKVLHLKWPMTDYAGEYFEREGGRLTFAEALGLDPTAGLSDEIAEAQPETGFTDEKMSMYQKMLDFWKDFAGKYGMEEASKLRLYLKGEEENYVTPAGTENVTKVLKEVANVTIKARGGDSQGAKNLATFLWFEGISSEEK
jgi:hypothetical protein